MERIRRLDRPMLRCTMWIAVCFSLTSMLWLSWEYHLLTMMDAAAADLYTMVAGYLLQAAGVGGTAMLFRRNQRMCRRTAFRGVLALLLVTALPALLSGIRIIVLLSGLAMNLFCGAVAWFYLYEAAVSVKAEARGRAFGFGYALSTVFVFLISLPGEGSFLRSRAALIVYAALTLLAGRMAAEPEQIPGNAAERKEQPRSVWGLALGAVALISLVKNLGFSFPAADLEQGVSVELSRVFYGAGLAAAGVVTDRNRKSGALFTAVSLAIPFVLLALTGENVPRLICWGLDYFFFGFFAVMRVVLVMDLAVSSGTETSVLAPLGLMAGRVGDAAGTAVCVALANHRAVLILLTLGLFLCAMLLYVRLCRILYAPELRREHSEQEVFASFAIQHDLSTREKDVLRLLLKEQSNTEIAEELFVSESTVKYHVHNLLQKTGCRSRQELVKKYQLCLYAGQE